MNLHPSNRQSRRPAADPVLCPICAKAFPSGKLTGWHSHVGPLKNHPLWHPEVTQTTARMAIFQREHPEFWDTAKTPQLRTVGGKPRRERAQSASVSMAPAAPMIGFVEHGAALSAQASASVPCPCCDGSGRVSPIANVALMRLFEESAKSPK